MRKTKVSGFVSCLFDRLNNFVLVFKVCAEFGFAFIKINGITIYYPKAGDTLWKIAKKYSTTVDKLKTINNLVDSNIIVAGNPLIIN